MKRVLMVCLILLTVAALVGCRNAEVQPESTSVSPTQATGETVTPESGALPAGTESAYPPPASEPRQTESAYPAPEAGLIPPQSAYPSPMASQGADENPPTITGERFNIDRPLVAGSMRVTGKGPIDVPLHVMDITTGGEILGSGSIGEDGRFAIDLGVPIPPAHIIGIQLSTPKDPNTWLSLWALQGEDARAIPQVGDFFDTALSTSQ